MLKCEECGKQITTYFETYKLIEDDEHDGYDRPYPIIVCKHCLYDHHSNADIYE